MAYKFHTVSRTQLDALSDRLYRCPLCLPGQVLCSHRCPFCLIGEVLSQGAADDPSRSVFMWCNACQRAWKDPRKAGFATRPVCRVCGHPISATEELLILTPTTAVHASCARPAGLS